MGASRPLSALIYYQVLSFCVRGDQSGGQTGLFRRVKASFGLNILALVKGGDQSRGQTGLVGRVKASFSLIIPAIVKGAVSQGVKPVISGASRFLSALIY